MGYNTLHLVCPRHCEATVTIQDIKIISRLAEIVSPNKRNTLHSVSKRAMFLTCGLEQHWVYGMPGAERFSNWESAIT